MNACLSVCACVLLSIVIVPSVSARAQDAGPGDQPDGKREAPDPRPTQLAIATAKFQEALAAIREAHRLMPIAIEKSVIYEETKANRKSQSCEDALPGAKTDSSRARKAFNEARGKAATSFAAAKRAVQELRRLGPDPSGNSPIEGLRFAADLETIEDCLKMLEQKLWKRINSALTERNRGYLWRDTMAYAQKLPASWDVTKDTNLVPDSVEIPCTGRSVSMHVSPSD
jgi:hypothetical protein